MLYSVSAIALLVAAANAVKVNFYWDRDCQQYAGSSFPDPDKAEILGGPYGSQSGLFVNDDGLPRGCSTLRIFCSTPDCNGGSQRAVNIGECVGDFAAIYATAGCAI